MRILLASHLPHAFINGGAQKALRSSLEHLVVKGHDVTVVCPTANGIAAFGKTGEVSATVLNGVNLVEAHEGALSEAQRRAHQAVFDLVLVPAEDPWQRPAHMLRLQGAPVVVIAQTPATLPFGPGAAYPNPRNVDLLESYPMIASSNFLADYVGRWSRVSVEPVTLSTVTVMPDPPALDLGSRPYAMMINPSPIKGLEILVGLAEALPKHRFAVVPGWATDVETSARLTGLSNIHVLPTTQNIFEHLRLARLLLVPSLWLENVPLIVTEAMLSGVPVVASKLGGIAEVAHGEGDFLNVSPAAWVRERGPARLVVPSQPVRDWISVVDERLSESEESWRLRARKARVTAEWVVRQFDPDGLISALHRHARAHRETKALS